MTYGWCAWPKPATVGLWIVAAMALTGCCNSEMRPYNTTVALAPNAFTTKPVIEVHLVGVSESENNMWANYSMSRYWGADDRLRQSAPKFVMSFGPNKPESQTLAADNPIWQTWLNAGATRLYVLAFLPERFDDAPGDQDPRRRILPLDKCKWPDQGKQAIRVTLLPSNVRVDTAPVAGK